MKVLTYAQFTVYEVEEKTEHYMQFLNAIEKNIQDFHKKTANSYGKEILLDFEIERYDYDFSLYSAFIMSIYSYLEQTLNTICKHYEKSLQTSIKLNDLKGSGIERAMLFYKKVIGIEQKSFNNEWSNIIDLNKIRNLLVHQGNAEKYDYKKNEDLGKQICVAKKIGLYTECEGIDGYLSGRLYLDKYYCEKSMMLIKKFITKLLYELPDLPGFL